MIILVLIVLILLTGSAGAAETKKEITIAILPCFDIVMTYKKFHPLFTYLEKQTGYEIRMAIQTDISEFELAVRNGDIDFSLQDPHTYVSLAELYNADALLGTRSLKGSTTRRGVIIVRRDSGIKEVADLRGKTVMFGPKQSIVKWIAAKKFFEENGIDIDKDLRGYRNGRCCEDIAFYVYLRAVDAGAVCRHFVEEYSNEEDGLGIEMDDLVVIAETDLMPTRVFAASKMIGDDIANRVIEVLLHMDHTDPVQSDILKRAELGGFEKARDGDYDDIRTLMGMRR